MAYGLNRWARVRHSAAPTISASAVDRSATTSWRYLDRADRAALIERALRPSADFGEPMPIAV